MRRPLMRFPQAHLINPNFTPVYGGAAGNYGCTAFRRKPTEVASAFSIVYRSVL
jgi:hypothetical protein